jgi:hypothetical protein
MCYLYPNPNNLEPKKIDFIFTTKLTKEKKNKIYNLHVLRGLRGVIRLFCHKSTIIHIEES